MKKSDYTRCSMIHKSRHVFSSVCYDTSKTVQVRERPEALQVRHWSNHARHSTLLICVEGARDNDVAAWRSELVQISLQTASNKWVRLSILRLSSTASMLSVTTTWIKRHGINWFLFFIHVLNKSMHCSECRVCSRENWLNTLYYSYFKPNFYHQLIIISTYQIALAFNSNCRHCYWQSGSQICYRYTFSLNIYFSIWKGKTQLRNLLHHNHIVCCCSCSKVLQTVKYS